VGERGKAMSGHPGKIAEHCRVAALSESLTGKYGASRWEIEACRAEL